MPGATGSVQTVWMLIAVARGRGADVGDLLAAVGLDAAALAVPDGRVGHDALFQLWHEIPARCGDDAFGVHCAETFPLGAIDVLEYSIRNSACLGDALARVSRFLHIGHTGAELRVATRGALAHVTYHLRDEPRGAPRHVVECIFASVALAARALVGDDVVARAATFRHARPTDGGVAELARVLRAPLAFATAADELTFEAAVLARPVRGSNPRLGELLDRLAAEMLARLAAPAPPTASAPSIAARARAHVLAVLSQGVPTVADTARALALSARSLQRTLAAEHTTYQQLVDELRLEAALRYLAEPHLTASEIAFLLGFADPSAFHRAFRRWTGSTVGEKRDTLARANNYNH